MDGKMIEEIDKLQELQKGYISDKSNFTQVKNQLNIVIRYLMMSYREGVNHDDPNSFLDSQRSAGEMTTENFITCATNLLQTKSDKTFLMRYPYLQEIMHLHNSLTVQKLNLSEQDLNEIIKKLESYIKEPLIIALKDMAYLASFAAGQKLNTPVNTPVNTSVSDSVSRIFNSKNPSSPNNCRLALGMVGGSITKMITPRMQSQSPYNLINWKHLQLLADRSSMVDNIELFNHEMPKMKDDFLKLTTYFEDLCKYEESSYNSQVAKPQFNNKLELPLITDFAHRFELPMNLEIAMSYLKDIEVLTAQDSKSNRMAILRIITVLGEVSINLLSYILVIDKDLFTKLREMHDRIVHADDYPSTQDNIKSLLEEASDTRLLDFAKTDLIKIREFILCLQNKLVPAPISATLNQMNKLNQSLTKDYKLTLKQKKELTSLLPNADALKLRKKNF